MCDSESLPIASAPCPCAGRCKARKSAPADTAEPLPPAPELVGGLRQFESEQLFAGAKSVVIGHAGEFYRLLITRNDRLVLHK